MAKCLFCTIRARCPRLPSGALDAPFARFAPPALNNFRHPWRQKSNQHKTALGFLQKEWGKIGSDYVLTSFDRMPRICKTVVEAEGGYFDEKSITFKVLYRENYVLC